MRGVALVACVVIGCGYPEFAFNGTPSDSAIDSTSEVASDAVVDTQPIFTGDGAIGGCSALGTHTFCADFNGDKYMEGWGDQSLTPLGKLSLEDGGRSGKALLAETQADPTATQLANIYQIFTAPSPDRPVRAEAWIKLEVASVMTQGGYLMKVSRSGDGVALSLGSAGLYSETSGGDYPLPKPVPVGTWFHVRIDAVLAPTTGSFSIYIDDMEKPVLSKTGVTTASMVSTERKLAVGLYSGKTASNMKVRFDDVTFDILP